MAAYYNEIDPKAAAWLRELIKQGHIADGVVDERSIVDVAPDELAEFTQCHFFAGIGGWSLALRLAGWPDDRPVWTGSCPCQPFSAAGARGGFDDQRHLWPHWHHLISQCRPSVVFGEQVASKDGLGWLDLVCADMEATGYAVGAADLCAAGVGAPHIRQRLWFVGLADAEGIRGNGTIRSDQWQSLPEAMGRGTDVGLADADHAERGANAPGRNNGNGHDAGRQESAGHAEGRGSDKRLADAADAGLQIGRGGSDREPGSVEQPERLRADGRLADADGWDASAERQQRGGEHGQQPEDGGVGGMADAYGNGRNESLQSVPRGSSERSGSGGINYGLGNADDQGSQEHGGSGDIHLRQPYGQDQGRQHIDTGMDVRASQQPCPTNGFWRDADWLFCRDGKWRPVESSIQRMADGLFDGMVQSSDIVSASFPLAQKQERRVMRLRGYGNAISPQVAQTFIASVMEITTPKETTK